MRLDVFDIQKAKVDEVELPDEFFPKDWKPWVVQEVLKELAQGIRSGTRKTKSRGEVSGGGRKPWRQKGTGRARQGSNTSPVWARGGTAHGPKPKDYESNVPKKKKIVALRQLLSFRNKQGQLFILESPQLPEPKTRFFAGPFASFLSPHKSALLVLTRDEEALFRASRNIPWAKTINIYGFNLFDLAKYDAVVFSKGTIPELLGRLQ